MVKYLLTRNYSSTLYKVYINLVAAAVMILLFITAASPTEDLIIRDVNMLLILFSAVAWPVMTGTSHDVILTGYLFLELSIYSAMTLSVNFIVLLVLFVISFFIVAPKLPREIKIGENIVFSEDLNNALRESSFTGVFNEEQKTSDKFDLDYPTEAEIQEIYRLIEIDKSLVESEDIEFILFSLDKDYSAILMTMKERKEQLIEEQKNINQKINSEILSDFNYTPH